ncbi:MAG: OmpA family protein [Gammaproteobacteria bacterium]|nr:OmpA family protein [Gammaproteobacteria bacterium]
MKQSIFSSAQFVLFVFLMFGIQGISLSQSVVSEKIIFLNEDGINYVHYDTVRTSRSSYYIWFKKGQVTSPEEHLKDYLYVYPDQYQWDVNLQKEYDLFKIASGNYASLVQSKLVNGADLWVDKDGIYTYSNWDGKTQTPENNYGIWNQPENFTQLVYTWVFPRNFNVISHEANQPGKWVKRNNTITYYGNNVNNLVFVIKYQPRSNSLYKELVKALDELDKIQLQQDTKSIKITLAATVLFSSGSSDLSERGKAILARLSKALLQSKGLKIIIEGHTDNVPISGVLLKKYKSNWELSSIRSLNVLHYMAEQKLPESLFESRALGSTKPVSSNANLHERSKNRRIEILLMDQSK